MALRPLDCVQVIVLHARFLDRLYHGELGLAATLRATKGLAAIVDILKTTDAQRGIAPANVAALLERVAVSDGLSQRWRGKECQRCEQATA